MKKTLIFAAIAASILTGCKHKHQASTIPNGFGGNVTYIGYAEREGWELNPGSIPIPSKIRFRLWHMVAADGTVYVGTKAEDTMLWFWTIDYCKHVWKARPGEWINPGSKEGMSSAWEWANKFDKNLKDDYKRIGTNCTFYRVSDGYVEDFTQGYGCWIPE